MGVRQMITHPLCATDDYTSYYAPDVIDAVFQFRPEEHCLVLQRRAGGQTEEEFAEMLHELALPGKDWRYDCNGRRSRLKATEMEPIANA
ncbi:hypothetical protein A2U01_0011419 [Trifolium medium]|uniref:Uncharacterized protein n=1 Tax=Trifolium medium TaxID=97028 RepID=A0A392MT53_9FABA|nr:hypothetical protein [Trifolium medium]